MAVAGESLKSVH